MKLRTPIVAALISVTMLSSTIALAGDRALTVLLGTGAGAVIGRSVAGRDGAVIGATAGALLALSAENQRREQQYQPRYQAQYAQYGQYGQHGNGGQYQLPVAQVYYSAPLPTYQQQYEQHYQQMYPAYRPNYQQEEWEDHHHHHHEWRREYFREHYRNQQREAYGYGH